MNNKQILLDITRERRNKFEHYLSQYKPPCVCCECCGFPTLRRYGDYELCMICEWEDDGSSDKHGLHVRRLPNTVSLAEARLTIAQLLSNVLHKIKRKTIHQQVIDILNFRNNLEQNTTAIHSDFDTNFLNIFDTNQKG